MTPNDYCTYTEARALMPDQDWTPAYDTLFTALAKRASREIDRYTNRAPGSYYVTTASDRYFTGDGSLTLYPGEMAAAPTAVAVAEGGDLSDLTAWSTASDYHCLPFNAADEGQPYTALQIDPSGGSKTYWPPFTKAIKVTAKWGYSAAVPDDVKQAALVQLIRWFKRGQQGFQDIGASGDLGQLHYVGTVLDREVAETIAHLRRQAI